MNPPDLMVITIECPSCASSFPVDPNKVPEGGVKARCSTCGAIFRVEKPEPAEAEPLPMLEPFADAPTAVATEEDAEGPAAESPTAADAPAEAAPSAEADDWVIEREEGGAPMDFAPSDLPLTSAEPGGLDTESLDIEPIPDLEGPPTLEIESPQELEAEPAGAGGAPLDFAVEPAAPSPADSAGEAPSDGQVKGFTFGKRDPTDKARRLARVLVSDMVMYNAERHQSALATGTLAQDFEEEIDKSWKEYVDQVGKDLAEGEGRGFWKEALNDILAKGNQIF